MNITQYYVIVELDELNDKMYKQNRKKKSLHY
jgi:hypothetical protein